MRALIYTVPYFFLNYRLAGWSESSMFFIVKGILFLSFLIVLPIHLLVNIPTRQALHDLILKTYVINLDAYPRQQLKKSRLFPIYVAGSIFILIIGISIFFSLRGSNLSHIIDELSPVKVQVDKMKEVGYSSISRNTTSFRKLGSDEPASKSEYLVLNIMLQEDLVSNLKPDNIEDLAFVKDAIRIIMKDYPNVNELDYIRINLVYGYNIGIYKSSRSLSLTNTVIDWRQKIK